MSKANKLNEINKTTEQIHTLHKNIEDTVKRIDVMIKKAGMSSIGENESLAALKDIAEDKAHKKVVESLLYHGMEENGKGVADITLKYDTKTIKEVTPEKLVIRDGYEIFFKDKITDEQVEAIKNKTMSLKDFYELIRDNKKG